MILKLAPFEMSPRGMKQRLLPNTEITVSHFVFGTGNLHHLPLERDRRKLLEAAADHGFTHFDTAPYYGFGLAEKALAPLLSARSEITVTTKVGLYPPGGTEQHNAWVLARKVAGKIYPGLSKAFVDWSLKKARESLNASLLRLARERIDILLLHEPNLALINTDEWLRWLESEKERVRYFGLAGEMNCIAPFIESRNPLGMVVQTADSLDRKEADFLSQAGRPLQLTYGYVSAALQRDNGNPLAVMRSALVRNMTGAILVSTRRLDRLRQYSSIA